MASSSRRFRVPFADSDLIRQLPMLFFFKRHPFRHVPKQWDRPKTDAEYQQILGWEGFITNDQWADDDLTEYPIIVQDLKTIDQHLMPTFWEFNQKAKHFQNNFYFYQWVFIIGAFLTTLAAVLTSFLQNQPVELTQVPAVTQEAGEGADPGTTVLGESQEFVLGADGQVFVINTTWAEFGSNFAKGMGWLTLIISLLTTYSATMTNHGEPRKKWNNYRRLTEELRMTYFKYLSHLEPFDKEDRVDLLRARVLEIRRKEQDNNG